MKLKSQSAIVVLLAGSLCLPALAKDDKRSRNNNNQNPNQNRMPPGRAQNNAPKPGDWLKLHLNETPQQQQREMQMDPEFQHLTPEQQQHLRDRLNQFNNLPPQQRERRLNNARQLEAMPADRRQMLQNSLQQFRQLPDDRRRQLRRAWNSLRQMPPEQQQQVLNSDRFRSQFNDQERSTLKGLLDSGFNPEENNGGPPPR